MKQTVSDRFLAKIVADPHGCWIWQSGTNAKGYGQFKVDGRAVRAHRFAYELLVGPIPDGLELDHLCRVRNCVNPAHLEPVTHTENVRRGESFSAINMGKTHCPAGHTYDAENTYVTPNGKRNCRTCHRAACRAYRARQATEVVA